MHTPTFHRITLDTGEKVYLRNMREATVLGVPCVTGPGYNSDGVRTNKWHVIDVTITRRIEPVYMSARFACLLGVVE